MLARVALRLCGWRSAKSARGTVKAPSAVSVMLATMTVRRSRDFRGSRLLSSLLEPLSVVPSAVDSWREDAGRAQLSSGRDPETKSRPGIHQAMGCLPPEWDEAGPQQKERAAGVAAGLLLPAAGLPDHGARRRGQSAGSTRASALHPGHDPEPHQSSKRTGISHGTSGRRRRTWSIASKSSSFW